MKSPRVRISLNAILPALVGACIMSSVQGCGPRKAAGPPAPPPPEVSVITVKTEPAVLATELPGRVVPLLVAEVRPQTGGIIQKRLFEEGVDVKAGDLLYQIDPALYRAAYDRAKADQGRAEAKAMSIKKKFDRYKKLIESSAISQQDFDNAESDLKMAEAEILSCKAAVETAWINLEYTKITAPISGRIGKSHITVGALVTANHLMPLAVIQQIDPIYVDVAQSSANLLLLKQEMTRGLIKCDNDKKAKVKLFLEDGTAYPFEGTLQFQDVTVEQSTGSFILRIVFPNPDAVLLPGMFVRAEMELGVNKEAILLPQQAVSRDSKGRPTTLIVDSTGKVGQRILGLGQAIGNKWIVSSGLAVGDRVVMEGSQKARPGAEVKAIPFEENPTAKKDSTNAPQPAATSK